MKRLKIVVIDGQGGRMGSLLIEKLKKKLDPSYQIFALGTNSIATAAMLRAGANYGATGENPVLVNTRDAALIIGPIGILAADALLGEITPKMAAAVGKSNAEKLLLPVSKCHFHIAGAPELSLSLLIDAAAEEAVSILKELSGDTQVFSC